MLSIVWRVGASYKCQSGCCLAQLQGASFTWRTKWMLPSEWCDRTVRMGENDSCWSLEPDDLVVLSSMGVAWHLEGCWPVPTLRLHSCRSYPSVRGSGCQAGHWGGLWVRDASPDRGVLHCQQLRLGRLIKPSITLLHARYLNACLIPPWGPGVDTQKSLFAILLFVEDKYWSETRCLLPGAAHTAVPHICLWHRMCRLLRRSQSDSCLAVQRKALQRH